jgi:hypothetical protein
MQPAWTLWRLGWDRLIGGLGRVAGMGSYMKQERWRREGRGRSVGSVEKTKSIVGPT